MFGTNANKRRYVHSTFIAKPTNDVKGIFRFVMYVANPLFSLCNFWIQVEAAKAYLFTKHWVHDSAMWLFNHIFIVPPVTPSHLGATRGDHFLWSTLQTVIPEMMISILHGQHPSDASPLIVAQLIHLISMVHPRMLIQHTWGTLVIISYQVLHLID